MEATQVREAEQFESTTCHRDWWLASWTGRKRQQTLVLDYKSRNQTISITKSHRHKFQLPLKAHILSRGRGGKGSRRRCGFRVENQQTRLSVLLHSFTSDRPMLIGITRFWQMFRGTVRGVDTSRQLALGITFGMFVGLLPKDSLLAYAFGLLMLLSTANLLCGAISGFAFSWIGVVIDGPADAIGRWILTSSRFEATWTWLYQMPIVPWTRFNNTVVMGSLIISLLVAIPLYYVSRYFFERYGAAFKQRIASNHVMKWLLGPPTERLQET
jgi:uncharacterized protein (TIGR03546 family)